CACIHYWGLGVGNPMTFESIPHHYLEKVSAKKVLDNSLVKSAYAKVFIIVEIVHISIGAVRPT
ncbi:MAG: hypothetical protein WC495_06570, partial [Patescibacteria group bacterium]